MRGEDALATILLVSRLCAEGVEPLKASEFWKLREYVGRPGELLGRTEDELFRHWGLEAATSVRIVRLLGRGRAMAFELERLGQSGISTLTPFDVRYPKQFVDKLGSKAPSLLYTAGDVDLLGIPAVGVVGSRDVSQEGAAVAEAAAVQAARQHCVLVSGGARGVDQLAMNAAFGAGGAVVGILADSLERNLKFPDVRRAIHYGQALMCSPYNPNAPFRAGNAMGRNKLVYALSDITLVVASDVDKGGTWAGAVEALKSNAGRVGVWRGPGQGPGNEELIERGGLPISSMAELKAAVFERPVVRVEPTYESQGLFL